MRWVLCMVLVTWVSATACDRRPEGELVGRPTTVPTSFGDKRHSAKSSDKRQRDRCMVPMSEKPPPKPEVATQCPRDPLFGGLTLKTGKLTFSDARGAPTIDVELALSPQERQRGLMYRTQMPDGAGMLFDFPGPARIQSFWMRNTCIPLDMLFITDDGFIAGVKENVPTLNDRSRSIPCPVRYVLEVNAGWTRAHGVRPGQFVTLPNQT